MYSSGLLNYFIYTEIPCCARCTLPALHFGYWLSTRSSEFHEFD